MKKVGLLLLLLLLLVTGGCIGSKGEEELKVFKNGNFLTSYNDVYFRGTPNGWSTTKMDLVADYTWETVQTFKSGDSSGGARFKIDVSGNWSKAYPSTDKYVTVDKTYKITFNEKSKIIDVKEYQDWKEGSASLSLISSLSLSELVGFTVSLEKDTKSYANAKVIYNETNSIYSIDYSSLEEGNYTINFETLLNGAVYSGNTEFSINKISPNYSNTLDVSKEILNIVDLSLDKYSDKINLGSSYNLATKGTALLSNGSVVSLDLTWDKSVNTNTLGDANYVASATYNGLIKTVEFTLTVVEVTGITIYVDPAFGDRLYAWNSDGKLLESWPGTLLTEKQGEFYKHTFEGVDLVKYIVLKNKSKVTGDKSTDKDIWWDKDGKTSYINPYGPAEMQSLSINSNSATVELESFYSLPISGTATMTDNTTKQISITWDKSVDTSVEGVYTFVGTGKDGSISKNVTFTLTVIKIEMESLTLSKTKESVLVGEEYTLPQSATATMTDNSKKEIAISWDKVVNTSQKGIYEFVGTGVDKELSLTVNFTLTVEELVYESLSLTQTASSISLGDNFELATMGTAKFSNGTTKDLAITWNKELNLNLEGTTTYIASANIGDVTKTAEFNLTISAGITIYVEEGFGDALYAWNSSGKLLDSWPGTKFEEKSGVFLKRTFVGQDEVKYIILKNNSKKTGDKVTTQNIWWDKYGKDYDHNPYGPVTIKSVSLSSNSAEITEGDNYNLPVMAKAVLSDNSQTDLVISWETILDTSKVGVTVYKGTVVHEESSANVEFTLTVNKNIIKVISFEIEPNNAEVVLGEEYVLPSEGLVNLSNGQTATVEYLWQNTELTLDTSVVGVYTYTAKAKYE